MQVGFMLIDVLARQLGISVDKLQHNAAVGRGRFCEKRVLLVKPMTFMNVSGEAVGKLARYYKVSSHNAVKYPCLMGHPWTGLKAHNAHLPLAGTGCCQDAGRKAPQACFGFSVCTAWHSSCCTPFAAVCFPAPFA